MRKRFSVVLAVEDVGKKANETDLSMMINAAETPQVDATLQESSDANPSPSASNPEQSKLAIEGKLTDPAQEGTFKEWIGKLEARVQDLSKHLS